MLRSLRIFVLLVLFTLQIQFVNGQISLTGTDYSQNFDVLASSSTSNTMPTGWSIAEVGTGSNTYYTAGTGSGTAADTYSFGATSSNERALGSICSNNLYSIFGAKFQNNTGATMSYFTITYVGEQWRWAGFSDRSGSADKLQFSYSTNATSINDGGATWTTFTPLDFISPYTSTTVSGSSLNGNSTSYKFYIDRTIKSLSIANGATFYIRWSDANVPGTDDGLAIDDFTLSTITTLPVNWVAFLAKETREGILLNWNTSNEINSNLFDVQHSTDGSHWNNIGNVAAAGNSFVEKTYSFLHKTPEVGNNFYRLNQIDIDGKSTYSNVVSILSTIPNTAVKILSNPIQNGLLQVQVGQVQSIVLQNAVGQIMVQKTLSQGLNNINVGNLPKGIYFVKVGNTVKKIVLQ